MMNGKRKSSRKLEWVFMLVVIILYIPLYFLNSGFIENSLKIFINTFIKVIPVIIVVFAVMYVVNLFADKKKIMKYVGESSGLKGWIFSIISGILSTGPIYIWYPLLRNLKEKGMKDSLIATFLYNRAVKIPLIPIMIYYFGFLFTVLLMFYMIIFSVINGLIVGLLNKGGR